MVLPAVTLPGNFSGIGVSSVAVLFADRPLPVLGTARAPQPSTRSGTGDEDGNVRTNVIVLSVA